jgi:hypothetical protein
MTPTRAEQRYAARIRRALPSPPVYLRALPDSNLTAGPHTARRVRAWCAREGVEVPTLLDVAAERARRSIRASTEPCP